MRFTDLPPPREMSVGSESRELQADNHMVDAREISRHVPRPSEKLTEIHHESLGPAAPASFRLRHLFNPAMGWFRRTERGINRFLSHRVFPRIPGISRPYSRALSTDLTVAEATLALQRLGEDLAGARVLLASDFHAGPFLAPAVLEEVFDRLMSLEPDLILLAGDFATVRLAEVEPTLPAYRILEAPLGVFGVLGNHDHYTGEPESLIRLLESTGIRFLQNRSVILERGSGRLFLAGIDDLLCGVPRLDEALKGRPDGMPSLLLSHNPDVFPDAVARGVSLVLAGHTHGGQWRVPGLPVLVRMSRYRLDEGRYWAGESELVVSRGLGATGFPIRIACPPEVTLLTLGPDEKTQAPGHAWSS